MQQTHTNQPLRVLVLGGYGNFGTRIVQAPVNDPDIQLLIGGRNEARATALARDTGEHAEAMVIDAADAQLATRLKAANIGLVIHTAGPFQAQGCAVAEACADAGAHCINLADGRRFVCDFPAAMRTRFTAAQRIGRAGDGAPEAPDGQHLRGASTASQKGRPASTGVKTQQTWYLFQLAHCI